ncbi:hypothetical protein Tco_0974657 [Tanacetum coccineum]|uniref:Retrovirus-related Pol polyprotein from transposon TNT 1-94-like beta-barrel domain-containing protein n=1 Tax=Tanacetum coccineum TaxID=301880 RepID=A0ABQ5EC67_9ASTR
MAGKGEPKSQVTQRLTGVIKQRLTGVIKQNKESSRRSVPVETSTFKALVSCDGLGGYDWSDQTKEGPNYALMAYSSSSFDSDVSNNSNYKFENASKSLNKLIESQIVDNCKKGLGYNAVPPPYTGNFMPPTPDLSFTGLDEFVNKPVVENRKSDEEVYKVVRKSNDSPIIEDWVSDSEEEDVSQTKTEKKIVKPSIAKIEFVKPKQQKKTARKTIKQGKNVNTVRPKAVVNAARPKAVVNDVKGNNVNAVKASACWVWKPKTKVLDHGNPQMDLQDKGVIDSGCSRHMTGNMSYLTDYEEIDGGYVAFGGNPKGGKITRKDDVHRRNYIPLGITQVNQMKDDSKSYPKVYIFCMKRIFRYLKGQPKLGLWYPKDSLFDLVAYTDSDYAGASLDRKSTDAVVVGLLHEVLQLPRQST